MEFKKPGSAPSVCSGRMRAISFLFGACFAGSLQGLRHMCNAFALETRNFKVPIGGRSIILARYRRRTIRCTSNEERRVGIAEGHNDQAQVRHEIVHRQDGALVASM